MLLRCAVLLLYLMVVRTEVEAGFAKSFVSNVDERYSLWPSIHHGVRLMRLRKREAALSTLTPDAQSGQSAQLNGQAVPLNSQSIQPNVLPLQPSGQSPQPDAQAGQEANIQSEGQSSSQNAQPSADTQPGPSSDKPDLPLASTQKAAAPKTEDKKNEKPEILDNKTVHTSTANSNNQQTTSGNSTIIVGNKTNDHNETATEPPKINLSDPGVMKRASIVFGGFALLATAYYFIIYRKKGNNNDAKNPHSSIDQNQFRYGVLESEDKSTNMELSRVPLTMESDDDDDEDLEIFDLGQKKRSLSYINLEQHDEDIVLNDSRSVDMENILVDIEDKNSDMINWSGNGTVRFRELSCQYEIAPH